MEARDLSKHILSRIDKGENIHPVEGMCLLSLVMCDIRDKLSEIALQLKLNRSHY